MGVQQLRNKVIDAATRLRQAGNHLGRAEHAVGEAANGWRERLGIGGIGDRLDEIRTVLEECRGSLDTALVLVNDIGSSVTALGSRVTTVPEALQMLREDGRDAEVSLLMVRDVGDALKASETKAHAVLGEHKLTPTVIEGIETVRMAIASVHDGLRAVFDEVDDTTQAIEEIDHES